MKTLIYAVRHGQSVGNLQHRFLGHTEMPLTDKGREQARCAGEYLASLGVSFDAVYASSLSRAYETAVLVSGVETPIPRDALREIHAGEWEGLLFDEIVLRYPKEAAVWNEDIGLSRPVGGESVRALYARVSEEIFSIAKENAGKTVLIGSHATPIRVWETFSRGLSACEAQRVPFPSNASLSAYLVDGEKKTVLPLFYSLDSYLGDLITYLPNKL